MTIWNALLLLSLCGLFSTVIYVVERSLSFLIPGWNR